MNKTISRDSSIELLRIISMLYIILYHFLIHKIIPTTPELDSITTPLISILHIGVICFVLISGFWGIKFSVQGFLKLYIQCTVYSILIYFSYISISDHPLSIREFILTLLPLQWWYIQVYLCLFLFVPIINIPLKNGSREMILFLTVILGVISYIFGQLTPSLSDGKNVINFAFIYYIGNIIRNDIKIKRIGSRGKIFLLYVGFCVMVFGCLHITSNIPRLHNFMLNRIFFTYNSLGLIVSAILFFLFFASLNIKSEVINWFSSSILPVYLLHENQYLSTYLYDFVGFVKDYCQNPTFWLIALIFLAVLVLIICVLIDKIINPIVLFIQKLIIDHELIKKYDEKILKILNC